MTATIYARSKEVHRALHLKLAPWFSERGWKKRPGATCAYMTPQQDAPGYHALWVQLSQWGDSWSGNQFTLNLASGLETPKDSLWTGERPLERLSLDDTAAGLELEREIVARIPHPAPDHWLHDELAKPGPEGDFWRSAYQRAFTVNESPWNPGKDIWLRYFSVQDVEAWADYLLPRLAYLLGDVPERGSSAA